MRMPNSIYIVESGSNENGDWVKYSDGTMICNMLFTENLQITTPLEGLGYYCVLNERIYPNSFINVPHCFIDIDNSENSYSCSILNTGVGATKEKTPRKLITCIQSNISGMTFNVFAIRSLEIEKKERKVKWKKKT